MVGNSSKLAKAGSVDDNESYKTIDVNMEANPFPIIKQKGLPLTPSMDLSTGKSHMLDKVTIYPF